MTFEASHHTTLPAPYQTGKRSNGGYWSSINIGGRIWRVYFEPRCKVCMSGLADQIHALAASSYSPRAIMDALNVDHPDHGFSQRNLSDHLTRHLPGYKSFGRALQAASSALKLGTNPAFASAEMYASVVLNTAFAEVVSGRVVVKPSDGIAAARLLHDMQRDEAEAGAAEFTQNLVSVMIAEMRELLTPAQFRDFLWRIRSHPGVNGTEFDTDDSQDGYIDAEVIDDGPPRAVPPPSLPTEQPGAPGVGLPVSEIVKFL